MDKQLIKDITINGLAQFAKGHEIEAINETLQIIQEYNIEHSHDFGFDVEPITSLEDFIKEINILITYEDLNVFHEVLVESLKYYNN
ncbi:hypothetical protein F358_104 [Campylobacter phage F358]|uniref:Uncharacterized protein n=6 Tax=Fletchervirus CPX TaxID=1110702 RepID=A0A7T3KF58_9CAUD|nr:hypothetical protein F357_105 [Campylobacter phage F357]QPX64075.1 hypothetical protein F358_104 [Campylobacter phage F358]QPX64238.1 hypothetical protein F360_105 [Campylobacter phage F360]QPX64403.1 hypothetical protein F361_106 [Campylobacter phage F361]QPX64732.1 hypothetical protein F367_106 [Campylobacter phage F367]QPX64897.1 hypothetical protein F368_106 [Campylobacter phage F368]